MIENFKKYEQYMKFIEPTKYKDLTFDAFKQKWIVDTSVESICEIKEEKPIEIEYFPVNTRYKKPKQEPKPIVEKIAKPVLIKKRSKRKHRKKVMYTKGMSMRDYIIKRDGFRCTKCNQFLNLEVHHIKQRSQGGLDVPENLITLCEICHYDEHKNEPISKVMKKRLIKKGMKV